MKRSWFGSSLALALLFSGCATHPNGTSNQVSSNEEARVCPLGTIALADESSAGTFDFQKGKGKLGSVKEAILDSASVGLSAPGAGVFVMGQLLSWETECGGSGGDPIFNAALIGAAGGATVIGAALAGPIVGAQGLIRSLQSVTSAELAQREVALSNALNQMAGQKPLREALLQTAAEKIQGGFRSSKLLNPAATAGTGRIDAVLEARVDALSLERAGRSEASFFLRIKTYARLTRTSDGAVYFEERAEYRSGTSLFLDWTFQGAIEGVAETGYRALARHYIERLLTTAPASLPHSS